MVLVESSTIETSHGTIYYTTSTPENDSFSLLPRILLIHGNSTDSRIFRPILESCIAHRYQCLAIDLPGHGRSSNSPTPLETYTMPGYAKAIAVLLSALQIPSITILGWSLGGHIALELVALPRDVTHSMILGIMIVGTPPVGPGEVSHGFLTARPPLEGAGLAYPGKTNYASTAELSEEQLEHFARGMTFRYEPWLKEAVTRTDGIARSTMWTAFEKMEGINQRQLVKDTRVLTGVVNGAAEPFIDIGYIRNLPYGNLFGNHCVEIEGLGHAPFWEDWSKFESVMRRWISDCEKINGI